MRIRAFLRETNGAAAVEYGLVLPLFVMLLLGALWAGLLSLSTSSLQTATQSAARCFAVNGVQCATPSATQSYALSQYTGAASSPTFTASYSGCGHTVTATATYDLKLVPGVGATPLTASACYP